MNNLFKLAFAYTLSFFILFTIYSSSLVKAQQFTPLPTNMATIGSEVQDLNTNEFTGELVRKEGNTLFIETDQGARQVAVPNNVQVMKNSVDSNLDSLQTGDRLTITQTVDGTVLSVSAIEGEVFDWGQWLIPALIILIILALIIWLLARKASKGHIKT